MESCRSEFSRVESRYDGNVARSGRSRGLISELLCAVDKVAPVWRCAETKR